MDLNQQGIGCGGEDAADLEFAAIWADPVVPQAAQSERGSVLAADPIGLLLTFGILACPLQSWQAAWPQPELQHQDPVQRQPARRQGLYRPAGPETRR